MPKDIWRSLMHFWHQPGCQSFPPLPSMEGTRQPWVKNQKLELVDPRLLPCRPLWPTLSRSGRGRPPGRPEG